ncbi:hypothetical protein PUN28_004341 [Cardiocondyla obscurior]|uniref:Uncharacterized protein n=1 Tax=Cardiocondyla obscurior TaxID=286306 RepID=A0AAW2GC70_9HYME
MQLLIINYFVNLHIKILSHRWDKIRLKTMHGYIAKTVFAVVELVEVRKKVQCRFTFFTIRLFVLVSSTHYRKSVCLLLWDTLYMLHRNYKI